MKVIDIRNVDILFGKHNKEALKLLSQGAGRADIKEKCEVVVGVQNAQLQVYSGEIFVLMGLSGSGKSTLLRCINGLIKPARGEVILSLKNTAGYKQFDVASCSAKNLRAIRQQHVSMVFQRFALFPWRSVQENVQFGLEIAGYTKASMQERTNNILNTVGLYEWRKRFPHELSGGMQQRVGLARALATNAEILLMDEPFSALDPLIRTQLQEEIGRLQLEFKKTIIFVSHDFVEALRIGTRIAIMNDAKIIQVGTAKEILEQPRDAFVERFIAHAHFS